MSSHQVVVNVEAAVFKDARYLMIIRGEQEDHAPGTLSFPGGKVEIIENSENILEKTIIREIDEEVGIEISERIEYVESKLFIADDGEPVVDIVFLCKYKSGTPVIRDRNEVSAVLWLTADEVLQHPNTPWWIQQSITLAEAKRLALTPQ